MDINITRHWTKNISLHITGTGKVNVRAPFGVSDAVIDDFIKSNIEWIVHTRDKIEKYQTARNVFFSQLDLSSSSKRAEAAKELDKIIKPLIKHYSGLMNVIPEAICYRPNKSRWGSCNVRKKTITFSTYLLLLPYDCIEHTVVHEMAHLLIPNHSKNFYVVMNTFFPTWKECNKKMKLIISP